MNKKPSDQRQEIPTFTSPIVRMTEESATTPEKSKASLLKEVERLWSAYLGTKDKRTRREIERLFVAALKVEALTLVRYPKYSWLFSDPEHDAEEICQRVWLQNSPVSFLEKWHPTKGAGLRTFLWTQMGWRAKDYLIFLGLFTRKKIKKGADGKSSEKAHPGASTRPELVGGMTDDEIDATRDPVAISPTRPDRLVQQSMFVQIVSEAIESIHDAELRRAAYWRIENPEAKNIEGAREMGIDDATFNRHLDRALRILKEKLGPKRGILF